MTGISTHAPRAGGDIIRDPKRKIYRDFNPRPPRRGRRFCRRSHKGKPPYFNPRPPRRGRLVRAGAVDLILKFQPTPPAQGATISGMIPFSRMPISTHAPRAGGDPTLPPLSYIQGISTHAPRAGGDFRSLPRPPGQRYFNPRPPRRGRHVIATLPVTSRVFQPTPPAQGATFRPLDCANGGKISTHAPRAGGDSKNNQNKTPDFP